MAVPARINLVTLGVADVAASTAFYEKLGWRRSQAASNARISFLVLDNLALALFGREALAADMKRTAPAGDPGAFSLAVNLPGEAAVDAAISAALEAGATLLKPAERTDWGGYSGYVADPDGHAWEFAHNPFFPLDADGRMRLPD